MNQSNSSRRPALGTPLAGCVLAMVGCFATLAAAGTLTGTVTGHDGSLVADAAIQLTDEATGEYQRTFSAADGSYQFEMVSPGTYRIAVNVPCCTLDSIDEEGLEIGAEDQVFDPVLPIGLGLGTLGDDFGNLAKIMLDRRGPLPDKPAPQIDGHPDLSGFWIIEPERFPEAPKPKPWAAELAAERNANALAQSPGVKCLPFHPTGPIDLSRFVQTGDRLVMLMEGTPNWRQVYLDGRDHPEDINPTWLGYSVGVWEGDNLVITTKGFNGRIWNWSFPTTEQMVITETFTRTSFGEMTYQVVFDDPEVFEQPWVQNRTYHLAPDEEVMETVCENNRW